MVLMCDLYRAQEAAVRTENGERKPFPIGKGVRQGCVLSPSLFNMYTKHIGKTRLDSEEGGVKTGRRNINNLRYADDTILLTECSNDLK